jgi:DNA-binding SARP family transcriptional activator
MVELRTLGTLEVRKASPAAESVPLPAKRIGLLAYLVLARPAGMHRRDTLLGLFWPRSSEVHARHSLSQALYVLKHALGPSVIRTDGHGGVGVDPTLVRCDAWEFEEALHAGDPERALALYTGDLLPGFFVAQCPAFDQWLEAERLRLRGLAESAAMTLANAASGGGDPDVEARWVRAARRHAPYDERLLIRLIEALERAGDRAGAVREYDAFAGRLRAELEVEPSAELVARIEAARPAAAAAPVIGEAAKRPPPPAEESAAAPAVPAVPAQPRVRGPRRWPGPARRTGLLALLTALLGILVWHEVGGRGQPTAAAPAALATGGPARVLVHPFTDEQGDVSAVGRLAAEWIVQRLVAHGAAEVVSPAGVARALAGTGGATPREQLRRLAAETEATIAVTGFQHTEDPGRLFLKARIEDVATGRVLLSVDPIVGLADAPLEAIERLGERVTGAMASLLDPRLAAWASVTGSPPSLEAYQLFVEGIDRFTGTPIGSGPPAPVDRIREAAGLFRQAFELDTTFAAALVWATLAHQYGGQRPGEEPLLPVLLARRERLPPWERHMTAYLAAFDRRDWEAAYRAMRRVNELTPGTEWAWRLAATALWSRRPAITVEILETLDPERDWHLRDWPLYCGFLVPALYSLGELQRGLVQSRRCRQLYPDYPGMIYYELNGLSRLGRGVEAGELALRALGQPADPSFTSLWIAYSIEALRIDGHSAQAERVSRAALDWYAGLTETERRSLPRRRLGDLLYAAEQYEDARDALRAAVAAAKAAAPSPDLGGSIGSLALAHARLGERDEAMRLWAALERLEPPHTAATMRSHHRIRLAGLLLEPEQVVRILAETWRSGELQQVVGAPARMAELQHVLAHPGMQELLRPRR